MRTVAALEERDEEIREIERATVAAIGSAERFIYIENQYVTSKTACEALVARMRAKPKLETVVVTTREPAAGSKPRRWASAGSNSWPRSTSRRSPSRIQFVAPLARSAGPDRRGASKIAVDGTLSIHVHAKVLIVDDTFLRIGSSNLNNRSMGFDTECDLAIEAENAAQRAAIASVRNRLIAEHWGSDEKSVAAALAAGEPVRSRARIAAARAGVQHGSRRASSAAAAVAPRGTRAGVPQRRADRARRTGRHRASSCSSATPSASSRPTSSSRKPRASATRGRLKWGLALLGARRGRRSCCCSAFRAWGSAWAGIAERVGVGIESLAGSPWRVPLVLVVFVVGERRRRADLGADRRDRRHARSRARLRLLGRRHACSRPALRSASGA